MTQRPSVSPASLLLVLFAALGLVVVLGGCRQASCAWDATRASVEGVLPARCCPEPDGTIHTTPIYSGGCAGDNRIGGQGTGAFRMP